MWRERLLLWVLVPALFVVTLYPALALQIYSEVWYELGCEVHGRCAQKPPDLIDQAITELTAFWRHQGELGSIWRQKEHLHLQEVRPMFDAIFWAFVVSVFLLAWLASPERIRRAARANVVIVLLPLLVLPFFKVFWTEIFHPLLFDNAHWRNSRAEISWYLMPKPLFMLSIAGLSLWGTATNLLLWLWAERLQRP